MTTRITEGQRRARWELSALARVGIDVCDPAAMLARMHAARTRRDEALARLRALVPP